MEGQKQEGAGEGGGAENMVGCTEVQTNLSLPHALVAAVTNTQQTQNLKKRWLSSIKSSPTLCTKYH